MYYLTCGVIIIATVTANVHCHHSAMFFKVLGPPVRTCSVDRDLIKNHKHV